MPAVPSYGPVPSSVPPSKKGTCTSSNKLLGINKREKNMEFLAGVFVLVGFSTLVHAQTQKPNIVVIVADDLGWNDVGYHGSNQIPTPNIDALAFSGVILNNYYVAPICTPSRSALMTGKYPIHTGMQHAVLMGAEDRGLPLSEKLLPEYLKEAGYTTRAVGKWHLGSWKSEYLPTSRGFDSHLGFWTGHHDYNDHTAIETRMWGLDMRRDMEVAYDLHGRHSTEVFTEEAVNIIHDHNTSRPLFLYLAHAAVHSGNPYNPICTVDKDAALYTNITDYDRKRFAGVLKGLDDSVGHVVHALRKKGILSNTIIIFTTDNGGPAAGFNLNAASNWPLRGVKNTLWEGGVRGAGLIWSPLITNVSVLSLQKMHITDWLPTLLSAASIEKVFPTPIDGIDNWPGFFGHHVGRTEVLHNIDDIYGNAALTMGDWKVIKGTTYGGEWDGWFGPSGRGDEYDPRLVVSSFAGQGAISVGQILTEESVRLMRKHAEVVCQSKEKTPCLPMESPCLFNIKLDPCEYNNLAKSYPRVLKHLMERLLELNRTAIPPGNRPINQKGNPKYWNNVWTNFGDYDFDSVKVTVI